MSGLSARSSCGNPELGHDSARRCFGYLGQIDKLYGAPATTRNWNTIVAIVRILKGQDRTIR